MLLLPPTPSCNYLHTVLLQGLKCWLTGWANQVATGMPLTRAINHQVDYVTRQLVLRRVVHTRAFDTCKSVTFENRTRVCRNCFDQRLGNDLLQ